MLTFKGQKFKEQKTYQSFAKWTEISRIAITLRSRYRGEPLSEAATQGTALTRIF
jgi:hypothetical protein